MAGKGVPEPCDYVSILILTRRCSGLRSISNLKALTFLGDESQTISGFGRNDRFEYPQRFGGPGEIANRVLLEAGTASG